MDRPPARTGVELKLAAVRNRICYFIFYPEHDAVVVHGINFSRHDSITVLRYLDKAWLTDHIVFNGVAGEKSEPISSPLEAVVWNRWFASLFYIALGVEDGRPLPEYLITTGRFPLLGQSRFVFAQTIH